MPWTHPTTFEAALDQRSQHWKLRTQTLHFNSTPLLMGIVNVTPDSFSDGGQLFIGTKPDVQAAVAHAETLAEQGAAILDIGGESTRPYSEPVAAQQELDRVLPVVELLATRVAVPISIDTSKASVAKAALEAGAQIINDVTGLSGDPAMLKVAAETGAGVCAMHMCGTPQTMQDDPQYDNVVADIGEYLEDRRAALESAGIDPQRVCLDPGIGFGKSHQHNLQLMANCWQYHQLGRPLLVGHSRKAFLAKLQGKQHLLINRNRAALTSGAAASLARQGVQVIRVHDVAVVRDTIQAFAACGGLGDIAAEQKGS